MLYKSAAVFFIDKPGSIKPSRMLADSFFTCVKRFCDTLQSYTVALGDKKQHFNAVVIRHALEMPLHLFRRFSFVHPFVIQHLIYKYNIPTNLSLLGCCWLHMIDKVVHLLYCGM